MSKGAEASLQISTSFIGRKLVHGHAYEQNGHYHDWEIINALARHYRNLERKARAANLASPRQL
jgi:hypothetical protein